MTRFGGSRLFWVLVVIALTGVVLAWTLPVDDAGRAAPGMTSVTPSQRPAIEAILASAGAKFQVDDDGRVVQLVARGPEMTDAVTVHLRQLPDLEDLQLEGSGIGAEGLQAIGRLERLQSLRLEKTHITDDDLKHLAALSGLRELFLAECPIGDAGMEAIGELTGLRVLDLNRTNVTDDGVISLKALVNLEKLYLVGTQVTGTGFAEFPETNRLTLLNLSEAPVTSEGLEPLRRFSKLQSLYLDGVAFDDALLAKLMDVVTASYPRLNGLFLSQTPLSDTAIEPLTALAEMPHLSLVGLNGTRISKAAFMQLASKTPETRYLVDYEAGNN